MLAQPNSYQWDYKNLCGSSYQNLLNLFQHLIQAIYFDMQMVMLSALVLTPLLRSRPPILWATQQ